MHTSVFLMTLLIAPRLAVPERPVWLRDYSAALDAGQKQHRPVAIFVGAGGEGQAALLKERQFSPEQLEVLAQKYVCVYLDRTASSAQALVRELGIRDAGLVIGNRTGEYQAFHHDGAIAPTELTRQLRHFSDPNLVVSTTVSNTAPRYSYYPGNGSQQFVPATRTVSC